MFLYEVISMILRYDVITLFRYDDNSQGLQVLTEALIVMHSLSRGLMR